MLKGRRREKCRLTKQRHTHTRLANGWVVELLFWNALNLDNGQLALWGSG